MKTRPFALTHFPSWIPFYTASVFLILLCILVGSVPQIDEHALRLACGTKSLSIPAGCRTLLLSAIWFICLAMLILYPRRVSFTANASLLLTIAGICRLVLLPHAPSDESSSVVGFIGVRLIQMSFSLNAAAVLFDMGTLGFLLSLLHRRSLDLRWSILYAFNPIILYNFAGRGHTGAIQTFFLLGAVFFYDRQRWVWMFLFIGVSVQADCVAVFTVPFFFRKDNWKFCWAAALPVLLAFLTFLNSEWKWLLFIRIPFHPQTAFNGPIHSLFRPIAGDILSIAWVWKIVLGLILLFGYGHLHPQRNPLHRNEPVIGCFFSLGAVFLISPTFQFQNLSGIIPFLAIRPVASWILLCLTVSGPFITVEPVNNSAGGQIPVWVQLSAWAPFGILFIHDMYLAWRRMKLTSKPEPPQSISVVIPALNEAEGIGDCIQAIRKDPAVNDVIIVDGGSKDDTATLARQSGARVVQLHPDPQRGRGGQIYAGIQEAKGDVIAIVHADTRLTTPAFQKMIDILARHPDIAGGALGSRFDSTGWRFRILEFANDFRAVFLGISFGDQVQFFRRKPVVERDLYPNIPLMEDVELSLSLHRLGRRIYLFGDAVVSTRRWQKRGFGHALTVIRLFGTYMWQRLWKNPDTLAMYRKYYMGKDTEEAE